ncbi:MAG: hypothetical protein ACJ8AO_05675 [Gemmatimonadaceae bacterium]
MAVRGLDATAFVVDGEPYTWHDVRAAAAAWGDWARQEAETARAAALVAAAPPAEERVSAAAREFRYARDLASGDDMRKWLDARGLVVGEWMDHVRRQVARRAAAGVGAGAAAGAPERDVLVDAICGGLLERTAHALAGRAALGAAAGDAARDDGADAAGRVARADVAYARACERLATPEALAAQVGAHRLEWLTVECRVARFASEPAAREAALCVRADGDALASVAAEARAPVEVRRLVLEDAGALRSALTGAAPGELLGPLELDGAPALVEVLAKRVPDLADAAVRRRAERAVLEGRMAAAVAERVRWM